MENKNQPAYPVMMQQIGDNEYRAAKPNDDSLYNVPMAGLTKREYFAAHAPNVVPQWFKHEPPAKDYSEHPDWSRIEDKGHRRQCREWLADPCYDLPEELKWFQEACEKADRQYSEWVQQNEAERYFQWRWHYADVMLGKSK